MIILLNINLEFGILQNGMVWYSMAWFGLLALCKYTTMQNFGHLGLNMTELCLFKIFGIFYDLV